MLMVLVASLIIIFYGVQAPTLKPRRQRANRAKRAREYR